MTFFGYNKGAAFAFITGAVFLLLGAGYYALFRASDSAMFLDFVGLGGQPLAYDIIPSMPSFIHVFSFSLMTASFVWDSQRRILLACFSWMFINIAFECAQLFLEKGVLGGGFFDIMDIVAAACGGACAILLVSFYRRKNEKEKHH